jgi:hypothetical protein
MATISYESALQMTESLPREEQLRLIQELAEHTKDSAEKHDQRAGAVRPGPGNLAADGRPGIRER